MRANRFLYALAAVAGLVAVCLLLLLLFRAPLVLAAAVWLVFPAAFVVLTVQLVRSQRPAVRQKVALHEDGSIEVQP